MTERATHLLVVDDDPELRELLRGYLADFGYRVSTAADGDGLARRLEADAVDLLILDVQLPGADGLDLCLRVRRESNLPIIMLTARGEETDRIVGLELGADDYLVKPFSPRELIARIKALLRRAGDAGSGDRVVAEPRHLSPRGDRGGATLRFGRWQLDLAERHLIGADGVVVALSGAEFRLLRAFLDAPGRVLSRDQLLDATQGREAAPFDRSIDVLVGRLRRRLGDDARQPTLIHTVRGDGYRFTPGDD